jgi:peptide/nickel transport system permease protein
MLFPGLFLLATTLAFNLVGDGLRDALDPRAAAMSFRRQHEKRREHKAKARAEKQGQPVAIEEHG